MARFSWGGNSNLIYFPLHNAVVVLPVEIVNVLRSCVHFQTIEDHVKRMSESGLAASEIEAWSNQLPTLVAQGGLVSLDQVLEKIREQNERPNPDTKIEWLTIPTHERSPVLRRSLKSYLANARVFDRQYGIVISDDSTTESGANSNLQVATHFAREVPGRCYYIGREEKRRYIEYVASTGSIEREVAQFALLGYGHGYPTYGANRNCLLLHTLGGLLLSVDDDTVCRSGTCTASSSDTRLRFTTPSNPHEFWFFKHRREALRAVHWHQMDFVGEHEKVLGRPLSNVLSRGLLSGHADSSAVSAHMLQSLWRSEGTVTISCNGVIGDSGRYSSSGFLTYRRGETSERLAHSEDDFNNALDSREVIRHPLSLTICDPGPFMGTAFGLDNRDWMPPFFPVCRNEDGLFGQTLACLSGNSFYCCLPLAIIHDPLGIRRYAKLESEASTRVSDILFECLSAWRRSVPRLSAPTGLISLGKYFCEIGAISSADFTEYVRSLLLPRAARTLMEYETFLVDNPDLPRYWKEALTRRISTLNSAVVDPSYMLPTDMLPYSRQAAVLPTLQKFILLFGKMLFSWHDFLRITRDFFATGKAWGRRLS